MSEKKKQFALYIKPSVLKKFELETVPRLMVEASRKGKKTSKNKIIEDFIIKENKATDSLNN